MNGGERRPASHPAGSPAGDPAPEPAPPGGERAARLAAAGVAVLIAAWAVGIIAVEELNRALLGAVLAPEAEAGVEAASAFAKLFGALVLGLSPQDNPRLRWVASGLVVSGLGALAFGPLQLPLGGTPDLNTSMYGWLGVRILAGALFVTGLLLATPPPFSRQSVLMTLAAFGALVSVPLLGADRLPPLVTIGSLEAAALRGDVPLPGLTAWHWALSALPLGLALAAVVGAARYGSRGPLGGWLLVAMVLLAGSQLHHLLWPSAYSPVLTAANLLRLAWAAVVAVGGVLALRRFAAEHAALLAAEREHSRRLAEVAALRAGEQEQRRRLAEVAALRADFTAMVAHELGSPLAAIRGFSDMLATGELGPDERANALAAIRAEADALTALAEDVQTSATVERDDFAVQAYPVTVGVLLAAATKFAKTLPGEHPVATTGATDVQVLADPERILQVLRNLLSNAAKYSLAGAPIELRARREGRRVRLEVADRGYGVMPEDRGRIFEKFGRARDPRSRREAGAGLGLYVSRRIVRAHGGELTVESTPGAGSVFGFDLEAVAAGAAGGR